jgi:hypothetical protein
MAENTITALVPDIYEALDVVSRELTGLIPSVTMNTSAARAGLGQDITIDVEPAGNGVDVVPAMNVPEPAGQVSGAKIITIDKSRAYPFGFIGEDQLKLATGPGYLNTRANKIAQAIRGLVNEVETDLAALQRKFSRAYGSPGTTPFATANDYTDASKTLQVLKDNGAPTGDMKIVMNTDAGAIFLGKQSAADAAGTDSILRQGVFREIGGAMLRESAQIQTQTAGSGANYTSTTAGFAVGTTSIPIITGTGVVAAGELVTFSGDGNKYMVASGVTGPGTITLAAPGLRQALAASAVAMTVVATSARNMVFSQSAVTLVTRAPARPTEGDNASDVIIITDTMSGLALEFSLYRGYRKVRYEVALAWGCDVTKTEHTSILLG